MLIASYSPRLYSEVCLFKGARGGGGGGGLTDFGVLHLCGWLRAIINGGLILGRPFFWFVESFGRSAYVANVSRYSGTFDLQLGV